MRAFVPAKPFILRNQTFHPSFSKPCIMKLFLHSKSLGLLLILAACTSASASLVNLYTFNGSNANDSVGGANGTVVDPGAVTATYFTSGNQRSLDLRGNTGQGSNSITEDAFVDLPNGIMTTAATTGTSGALSISVWVTVDTNRNWAEIYAFGTSNGGENTAGGGSSSPYLALIPSTGDNQSLRSTTHSASGVELSVSTAAAASLSTGVQHHLVTVYDQSGGVPGTISFIWITRWWVPVRLREASISIPSRTTTTGWAAPCGRIRCSTA
jgi:hypothetical protein